MYKFEGGAASKKIRASWKKIQVGSNFCLEKIRSHSKKIRAGSKKIRVGTPLEFIHERTHCDVEKCDNMDCKYGEKDSIL